MKKYLCEFLGTFFLVFLGCGGALFAAPDIGVIGVSFCFGLSLLILVYTLGPISGCHLNPAVTLCLAFVRKFPTTQIIPYIVSQCLGAILAGYAIYIIAILGHGCSAEGCLKAVVNGYGEHSPKEYSLFAGLGVEIIMTSLLLSVILSTTRSYFPPTVAGVVIGLTLALIHMVSIPITNTSVNFARSLGVAVLHGGWALSQLWVFALAHIIAVFVAALFYRILSDE